MVSLNPKDWFKKKPLESALETHAVDDLDPFAYSGQTAQAPWENSIFDGGKFFGGFGATQLQTGS